jgi:hypothetical protein
MEITNRDWQLVQEELKCLRTKLSSTVGTSGGYTDVITSPGSSVYPDNYFEDCECVDIETFTPDPTLANCGVDEGGDTSLGDFAGNVVFGGLFEFDAINGVFYLPPDSSNWENRNTGLSDTRLSHGCKDLWWYRKKTLSEDNIILWRTSLATVLRSENAGRSSWNIKTPTPPTGVSISQINFKQIISDPFRQNTFYILAEEFVQKRTFLVRTQDDGVNWAWTELTTYNGVTQRKPIWMCTNGNGGNLIWVSTWGDNLLRVLKINNDPTPTISAEYSMGAASEWEAANYFETLSPISQVDTNTVWFYGRASNPQSLGLTHIMKTVDEGLNWVAVEQSWGDDWCGSMKVSLENGGSRKVESVRNKR